MIDKNKLVVFEGTDGTGKTTLTKMLLESGFMDPTTSLIIQPSHNNSLGFLRKEVKEHSDSYSPTEIQSLHTMSHIVDVFEMFGSPFPHNRHNSCRDDFIMDRSHISTYVYGKFSGLSDVYLDTLTRVHFNVYHEIMKDYQPIIFFLDSSKNHREGGEQDNFEKSLGDSWNKLRDLYKETFFLSTHWFSSSEKKFIIDTSCTPPDQILAQVEEKILEVMNESEQTNISQQS